MTGMRWSWKPRASEWSRWAAGQVADGSRMVGYARGLGMNQRGSRGARMSRLDEDDESLVARSRSCVYRVDRRMSGARDLAGKKRHS